MVVVRPVAVSDLDALVELAGLAGVGLTTLPKDRDLLAKRIARSVASLQKFADRPGGETYLFVMEDLGEGVGDGVGDGSGAARVVGACGITSKVGGFQPFYAYRIETQLFESKAIGVHKEVPILTLVAEHDGPCEIGSLFLHPEWRRDGNGKLLQLVRFLFIAEHAELFEPTVISEIRGQLDDAGHSPFWDALGRHFFGIDFAEADRLSNVNKKFIAELMPDHPIYIPLLPDAARAVIGRPHRESASAVRNLEAEGFRFGDMIDIFDAGPMMVAGRDDIRTVRNSRRMVVEAIANDEIGGVAVMVGTTTEAFRACKAFVQEVDPGGVRITRSVAKALQVQVGDAVRIVKLTD
ncbi:MAG TPA: arginine N-succinyltransferase [Tepidisphaeraceae bacterium]|nr:arginine N-succinyltransferase [Tepidisphaeraceae bacterium]